jgi:hypothetical protein
MFCLMAFRAAGSIIYRVIFMTKSNLRKLPDGRVVGSPKLQIVILGSLRSSSTAHRGTEVISSPAAREKLCLQGSRVTLSSLPCSATKPEVIPCCVQKYA